MDGSPTWSLGPLVFDPDTPDSFGVHWILVKEEGFWASPATGAEVTQHLSRHGAIRTPGYKSERTITLEGRAFAPDAAALRHASIRLSGLLTDPHVPVTLTCHSEIGAICCDVFLDDQILTTPTETAAFGFEWSLQLVAPDPRRYSLDWSQARTGLPSPGQGGLSFGAGLAFGRGLSFGATASAGTVHLTHHGTAPTTPLLTLAGPLTRPVLTAPHGTLAYLGDIERGDHITIDPAVPSATLNGRESVRHLLYPAHFAAFTLPAHGSVALRLHHDGPADADGALMCAWRHAWF